MLKTCWKPKYFSKKTPLIFSIFVRVKTSRYKEVIIKIPVKLNGLSIGVKEGGKLALETRKLRVKALPKNLPDILNVDVTELKLGKTIKVGDLSFEDLELLDFKNSVVCSVKLTRVAKSLDEETEGEETEEATTEE